MSNLEDLARDVFDENGGWCKINGEILGALADFSGALGIAQLGINLVTSFLAKDEEAQKIIAAIQKDFQDLKAFIAAEDKLARMRDVDLGMKDAVAVFQRRGFTVEKADVFFVEIDVEELADLPLLVVYMARKRREARGQFGQRFGDRACSAVHARRTLGEATERCGNFNCYCHF